MELSSFRELLLKKSADNPTLHTIISVMRDDLLVNSVIEVLEKMAHAGAGRTANGGVAAFSRYLKNSDIVMLRDALSHHVSHYKAALKNNKRGVADEHLNHILPLMHLISKVAAHSGSKLKLAHVPTEAWETNYTSTERNSHNNKLKEGTKGIGRPLVRTSRDKNPRGVPDYRYLEMPPHPEHSDTSEGGGKVRYKKHSFGGGYPFEEIQVGRPADVDADRAYLDIRDVGANNSYVPHAFDKHPLRGIYRQSQDEFRDNDLDFEDAMREWHNSDEHKNWMAGLKQRHADDPNSFLHSGLMKPEHHFNNIELQRMEQHGAPPPKVEVPPLDITGLPESIRNIMLKQQAQKQAQPQASAAPSVRPAKVTPNINVADLPEALRSKVQQSQKKS